MTLHLQMFVTFSGEVHFIAAICEWLSQACTTFHLVHWSAHAPADGRRYYLIVPKSACRSAFQNFPALYAVFGFLLDTWTLKAHLAEHDWAEYVPFSASVLQKSVCFEEGLLFTNFVQ